MAIYRKEVKAKESKIEDLLINSKKTDKEIANMMKVDLGVVKKIKKQINLTSVTKNVSNTFIIDSLKEEDEKMEVVTTGTTGRKPRKVVTEDMQIQILCMLDEGYTYRKIAEELGISAATVGNHVKKLKAAEEPSENTKEETTSTIEDNINEIQEEEHNEPESIEPISTVLSPKSVTDKESLIEFVESRCNTVCKFTNKLEVGMFRGRHDMPVKLYVFDEAFDNSMISNYKGQEMLIEKFIRDHINFVDDKPDMGLCVYATGLQCALVSIIKVCYKLHVNLDVRHYDGLINDRPAYKTQKVITEFECSKSEENEVVSTLIFPGILYADNKLYYYNCEESDFKDYKDGDEFFIINFNVGTNTLQGASHIICKTLEEALSCYAMLYPAIRNIEDKVALSAATATVKNNATGTEYGTCIARI